MTLKEVMAELQKLGSEQTRKTWRNHGAQGDLFGVKIGDLKTVAKKIKGDQALALQLYETKNADAMYLAGLVADGAQMTKKQLNDWTKAASWPMVSEYTVAWVTAESPFARELALKWIDSTKEPIAASGWNAYSGYISMTADGELDLKEIEVLLDRVVKEIRGAPNRVRYCMNGFVLAVAAAVKPLLPKAKLAAERIGKVDVDMGDTSCQVPVALEYIRKMEAAGKIGKKRKSVKC